MALQGKNVAYVGGFGGIGYACCKELIERGIQKLVILDVKDNTEKRQQLLSLNANLKYVSFVPLNLCDGKAAIEKALQETATLLNPIDILINGAGILNDRKPRQTVDINLMAPIETTLAAIPLMRRDAAVGSKSSGGGGGLIVNVASVLGLEPAAFAAVYTATKYGMIGFTRACAHDHYHKTTGISHMAICPGPTGTDLLRDCVDVGTFDYSLPLSEEFDAAMRQTAEDCAKPMADAIEKGKNGSICIVDLGQLDEVNMPKHWEMKCN